MEQIIKEVFKEMVREIELTQINGFEPNRYHKTASVNEVNLVYHFVKILDRRDHSVVYLEFPCDSGRVDAVVLYENNILFIEAKTNMDNKKYKVLDAQATRFENKKDHLIVDESESEKRDNYAKKYFIDSSLRDTLDDRVLRIIREKWNIESDVRVYGILLADTLSKNEMDKWDHKNNPKHFATYRLNCIKTYTVLDPIEKINKDNTTRWFIGSYKQIDTIKQ